MTKARGAADSIGKAGRGASFLLPAFSPYYVPYFPLFLRARTPMRIHIRIRDQMHTYTSNTYTRVLFPFCPPPRLRRPLVLSSFTLHAILLLSLSSSSFRTAFVLFVAIVRACTRVRVYVRLVSIVREVSCRTGSTLPRREGGFVRG